VAALEAALAHFNGEQTPIRRRLIWNDEFNFGYYPVDQADAPYDALYFAKYAGYAKTRMGAALEGTRLGMVARYTGGPVVDIGIGSGSFIAARPLTWGYDINRAAVEWLHASDLYWNPYIDDCRAVTMWDSLEHIPRFHDLLEHVLEWAFVSLPVFTCEADVLGSRHFRTDEHCWYFTPDGFIGVMRDLGWNCLEENWTESMLGRESIASFAFRRVDR
jgi:hypothetical protein